MYSFCNRLARLFALIGGLVLSVLVVLTCLSIAGRLLNGMLHADWLQSAMPSIAAMFLGWGIGPINGDFEIVEAGMAFAIFAFLPLCHLNGAHASVDIFTSKLPARVRQILGALVDVVFAAVLILIALQLFEGMQSKRNSGQTTLLLEFPVWWGYAASLAGAFTAAFISVYIALVRIAETVSGHQILPAETEAEN